MTRPTDVRAELAEACRLYNSGKYEQAEQLYQQLEQDHATHTPVAIQTIREAAPEVLRRRKRDHDALADDLSATEAA